MVGEYAHPTPEEPVKLTQLSLFLENRPGQLKAPVRMLADAGINIITLSLADTQQFGILRLIIKDWQKARDALREAGFIVNTTEVLAIDVADRPGGLAEVLEIVDQAGLAIEYMYAFTGRAAGAKATLILRFENADAAIRSLSTKGINVIGSSELFERSS
jgi:hypothetical protein